MLHLSAAVLEERDSEDGVVLVPVVARGKFLDLDQLAAMHAGGAAEVVVKVASMEARAVWDSAVLSGWAGD